MMLLNVSWLEVYWQQWWLRVVLMIQQHHIWYHRSPNIERNIAPGRNRHRQLPPHHRRNLSCKSQILNDSEGLMKPSL
jgi:hypothetical protein